MKNYAKLLPLLALSAACAPAENDASFNGVSEAQPTGTGAISSEGLVAAYDFETYSDDGRLVDLSGNGNDGAVQRRQETDGQYGKARVFSDLTDVVDIPQDKGLDLPGPLTIAAWVRNDTSGLHQHHLSCDDIFVLWSTVRDEYRLADTVGSGITTAPGTAPIGSWHSVVGVLDATRGDALTADNIRIYVNGIQLEGLTEPSWAPGSLHIDDGCLIGASSGGYEGHELLQFEGAIDEMLVFNRPLSDAEIQAFTNRQP